MSPSTRHASRRVFATDVASSLLFFAPAQALIPLTAFVAAKRFDAPPVLVGSMITGAYVGYIWNLFFSRIMARLPLKRSVVTIMLVAPVVLVAAALQTGAIGFCLAVLVYLVCYGIGSVQYNASIKHLYAERDRVSRLSLRFAAISATVSLLSVLFGRISVSDHTIVLFASAAGSVIASFVFASMPAASGVRMSGFGPRQIFGVFRADPAMRLIGIGLGIYGIVGSALHIPTTYLYERLGYAEDTVGILSAVRIAVTVVTAIVAIPRLKQPGGFANFRIAFLSATLALAAFIAAGLVTSSQAALVLLFAANGLFGVGVAGFEVALQTTAIGLAPEDRTSLYVNALMIVFGVRGLLWPLIVGFAMQFVDVLPMLVILFSAAAGCFLLSVTHRAARGRNTA